MTTNNSTEPLLGFHPRINAQVPPASARPTPLTPHPKGRWFIGLVLVGICVYVGYNVWNSFFRFQAYGTITGRTIDVAPPWDGVVRYLHVREGDAVRQGQLLVTADNFDLRQRYAQLGNELRVAQATLGAETAKLKWQAAFGIDENRGAFANYYESLGNLLRNQARLQELESDFRRAERLHSSRAISTEEYDRTRYAKQGQQDLVAKLQIAVGELKKRSDEADQLLKKNGDLNSGLERAGHEQLQPFLARLEAVQGELQMVRDKLTVGELRSPANGTVLKSHHAAGERCLPTEPLITIMEEGSLQVVLYMPQGATGSLKIGDGTNLVFDPYSETLRCRVTRLGDRFEPAPDQIKRHYTEGEKLLPVYLKPQDEMAHWLAFRAGGVVKLSYALPQWSRVTHHE